MSIQDQEILIPAGEAELRGILYIPEGAQGLVVFAHGSGSSRHSPRNTRVARALQRRGLATLLFDLLTASEERVDLHTGEFRFDIEFLAQRLVRTCDYLSRFPLTSGLVVGLFGSSTGAAAALLAAVERPEQIRAVVSRGGRPDLVDRRLLRVGCPTLLIVGGADVAVLALHRDVLPLIGGPAQLQVVPHATHLFEEPGALEVVCRLAGDWFNRHLTPYQPQPAQP